MPPHASSDGSISVFDNWTREILCSNMKFEGNLEKQLPNAQCFQLPRSSPLERFKQPTSSQNPLSMHCNVNTSETPRRRHKPRRNVTFFPEVTVYTIPNREDLPKELLYLNKEEMVRIHHEAWQMVDLMNCGLEYEDQEGFSKRGLVDLKVENVERRKRTREYAYKVVFSIQNFSKHSNVTPSRMDVSKAMAEMYSKAAHQAQLNAYHTALQDAIAAEIARPSDFNPNNIFGNLPGDRQHRRSPFSHLCR